VSAAPDDAAPDDAAPDGAARGAETAAPPGEPHLSGHLGVTSIVFMVIAAAAPLTVINGNVPLAVTMGNGAGAPVGYLVAALVLLLFSVGFVAMTPHVPQAGAFFAYVEQGLGARAGLGAAYLALVTYTTIQVGVWGYFGGALSTLVHDFGGPEPPWWVGTAVGVALVAVLGYRRIELSSKVLGVALVCEIGVVLVMNAAIIGSGGAEGIDLAPFAPGQMFSGSFGIAVLFSITGFIGFEATAVFRDEARDPDRTLPRATYVAVLVIGLFYTFSAWAVVEGWGVRGVAEAAAADPDNMVLNTAERYIGGVGKDFMECLLVTSLLACTLSFHNVVARYQLTLAGRSRMPSALGRVHPRHGSPHVSSVVQTVTATVLLAVFAALGMDPLTEVFSSMAGIATLGVSLLMTMTSVAVLAFFRGRADSRWWQTRLAPALGALGLVACLCLIVGNFALVVEGTVAVAVGLGIVPPLAFALGYLHESRAQRALTRQPDTA